MTDIVAKVAYLQGLAEGLDISDASAEGRLLTSVIDVLGDIAEHIVDADQAQAELAEYVEDVDYDLGSLEETVLGEEEPEITFIPDRTVAESEVEDGIEILSCPACGETLAAGYGEIEVHADSVCPACGCEIAGDLSAEH